MMRCYVVTVLVVGFSSLTACGGASNGVFAPRVPAASVRPLSDVLYSFGASPDAEHPSAGLLAGKKGEYYGTSFYGGSTGDGAVYEVTVAGKEKVLYSFQGSPDGANPKSTLIMDKDGALYGTTEFGGSSYCGYGCGIVFKLTPGTQGWSESVLYEFQGGNDGARPVGGLMTTTGGALFGTTENGGGDNGGVVFALTPSGSTYSETIIHAFAGPPDGFNPTAALISDSNGNLYGTTFAGGFHDTNDCPTGGCGTVFKLRPSSSTYTESVIYKFKGGRGGKFPSGGLLPGPNAVFYGLTAVGGPHGDGTVFELTPKGSHRERALYEFKGGSNGSNPDDTPGLVADRSGNLYGTTVYGGGATACTNGCGTVFKLVPAAKGFTESVVYAFQGGADGANPYGSVLIGSKGNLLGPTYIGGIRNFGTIFSIAP
ncbi:MAG TPA: choice-of-anchor tandem repeat GloVer-containing protein [Candidatus Cybelea sp.]